VLAFFDQHFDELYDGLKEMSLATMAGNRSAAMRPGVFTFPLEFASLKPQLRAFLATLFEENTWQFKPVMRGFYFTSALQEGMVENLSSRRVASRFDLQLKGSEQKAAENKGAQGGAIRLLPARPVPQGDLRRQAIWSSATPARPRRA
jgi:type VI secretion system protein ImpL